MKQTSFDPSVFVGTDDVTKKYQRKYLRYFKAGECVLDVGCGNGIFLELLRERGIRGVGIDASATKVAKCRSKRLEVHRVDALRYIKRKSQKFHGIFCSHFVEHFSPSTILEFLHHAFDRLEAGGLLIIITPNYKNIDVISERFWMDITHVRPYPIPLLEKMLEASGFDLVAQGVDSTTRQGFPRRKPWLGLKYVLKKIRFGEYFGAGDSFVVAKKT